MADPKQERDSDRESLTGWTLVDGEGTPEDAAQEDPVSPPEGDDTEEGGEEEEEVGDGEESGCGMEEEEGEEEEEPLSDDLVTMGQRVQEIKGESIKAPPHHHWSDSSDIETLELPSRDEYSEEDGEDGRPYYPLRHIPLRSSHLSSSSLSSFTLVNRPEDGDVESLGSTTDCSLLDGEGKEKMVEEDTDLSLASSPSLPDDLPAIRPDTQYKHTPDRDLNSRLNVVVALTLACVVGLGLGHFLGWSSRTMWQENLNSAQVRRLRELQDDLVSCMSTPINTPPPPIQYTTPVTHQYPAETHHQYTPESADKVPVMHHYPSETHQYPPDSEPANKIPVISHYNPVKHQYPVDSELTNKIPVMSHFGPVSYQYPTAAHQLDLETESESEAPVIHRYNVPIPHQYSSETHQFVPETESASKIPVKHDFIPVSYHYTTDAEIPETHDFSFDSKADNDIPILQHYVPVNQQYNLNSDPEPDTAEPPYFQLDSEFDINTLESPYFPLIPEGEEDRAIHVESFVESLVVPLEDTGVILNPAKRKADASYLHNTNSLESESTDPTFATPDILNNKPSMIPVVPRGPSYDLRDRFVDIPEPYQETSNSETLIRDRLVDTPEPYKTIPNSELIIEDEIDQFLNHPSPIEDIPSSPDASLSSASLPPSVPSSEPFLEASVLPQPPPNFPEAVEEDLSADPPVVLTVEPLQV